MKPTYNETSHKYGPKIYLWYLLPTIKWASPLQNLLLFCLKPLQHHQHIMVCDTLTDHLNPTILQLRPAIFLRKKELKNSLHQRKKSSMGIAIDIRSVYSWFRKFYFPTVFSHLSKRKSSRYKIWLYLQVLVFCITNYQMPFVSHITDLQFIW